MQDLLDLLGKVVPQRRPRTYLEIGTCDAQAIKCVLACHPDLEQACLIPTDDAPPEDLPSPEKTKIEVLSGTSVPGFFSLMNSRFDMVLVRGGTSFRGEAGDLLLGWFLLNQGGTLIFDGISHPEKPHLMVTWTLFAVASHAKIFSVSDTGRWGTVAASKA